MPSALSEGRPLNDREAAFVAYRVAGKTGAEAARLAGYSPGGARQEANRLMKRPDVLAAVERGIAERDAATAAARTQIVQAAADVATLKAITEAEVIETHRRIVQQSMERGELAVARAANRDLGEHIGMFKHRVSVETPPTPPSRLSDHERARMLRDFFADRHN